MTTAPTGNRIIIPFSSGVIGETTYSSSVPLSISFFRDAEGKRVVTTNEEGLLYARGSTVMQGYYGRPEALRRVFHPQPLYRGPRQPTMGAGVVFDAWVSYGRCDLAHEKSANAQARIAKVFETGRASEWSAA